MPYRGNNRFNRNARNTKSSRRSRPSNPSQPRSFKQIKSLVDRLEFIMSRNQAKQVARRRSRNQSTRGRGPARNRQQASNNKPPVKGQRNTLMDRLKVIEQANQSKAVAVEIATQAAQDGIGFDLTSFPIIAEALSLYYGLEHDLFASITPRVFTYYLGFNLFAHLNNMGGLTNATSFPMNSEKLKFAIPYAFAKWLEYISNYKHDGVEVMPRLNYAANMLFTAVAADGAIGNNDYLANGIRPASMPNIKVFSMTTTASEQVPSSPQSLLFIPGPGVNFSTFVQSATQQFEVSVALAKRGNTIPMSEVPTQAPDSSAFSKLASITNLTQGCYGVDNNYDPELTYFFSPTQIEGGAYSDTTKKPYKLPYFTPANMVCPDYWQIASTWVWLAQHYEGDYRPGKFRDCFTFDGKKLKTLYPLIQTFNGAAIGESVQSSHTQYVNSKQNTGPNTLDPFNTELCIEATVGYACQQYRRNRTEVIHLQCPSIADGEQTVFPQIFYVDSCWSNQNSPLVAVNVSLQGPVVLDEQLRIPWSNYENGETSPEAPVGPAAWSAFGFDNYSDDFNNDMSLTVPWVIRQVATGTPTPPNVVWDDSLPPGQGGPFVMNSTNIDNFYGYQLLGGTNPAVYPIFPTGGSANCIQNQFLQWVQESTSSQTASLSSIAVDLKGHVPTMTVNQVISEYDASLGNAQPNGTDIADTSQLAYLGIPVSGASFPNPTNKVDASLAAMSGAGIVSQREEASAARKSYYKNLKTRMALGQAIDLEPPIANIGPHNIDIPWSTGKSGLMASLSQLTTSSASPFATLLSQQQMQPGFDIVALFKKYAGPILNQSMQNIPTKQMDVRKFLAQSKTLTRGQPDKTSFKHKLLNITKKGFEDVATMGANIVVKEAKKGIMSAIDIL